MQKKAEIKVAKIIITLNFLENFSAIKGGIVMSAMTKINPTTCMQATTLKAIIITSR